MTLNQIQRRWLWAFLAIAGVLRILMIFEIPFTDTTEARYAEIARKMVETGDWITPQFDYGVPFWGKPPLYAWVSALGMKLFGVGHFGARIFIFLIAVVTLWMLYLWAKSFKGRDYALAGIVILSSSALFYLASATVMTDMVMASGVFLSMAGFYAAISKQPHARLWGYLFFVGLGIGMLAKGPVAVVLAGIPIGLWVLLQNRWSDTWRHLPWIEGSLLTACMFLPWYVAAEVKTPGFLEYFIIGEHWHRFLDSGWKGDLYGHGHAEARGTIWVFWLAAVLPWSFFFLAPLRWSGRIFRGIQSEQNGWSLYLICWAISPMLFFSLATNIIATYVITGLPAVSFLAIELWTYASDGVQLPKRGVVRFYAATVTVAVLLFGLIYGAVVFDGPAVAKKTQKYLVEDVNQMRGIDAGHIYYLDKRYYSAEFYARGQVHTLDGIDQLDELLLNQERDFLVIRKNRIDQLPDDFSTKFKFQGLYGKNALYYEL